MIYKGYVNNLCSVWLIVLDQFVGKSLQIKIKGETRRDTRVEEEDEEKPRRTKKIERLPILPETPGPRLPVLGPVSGSTREEFAKLAKKTQGFRRRRGQEEGDEDEEEDTEKEPEKEKEEKDPRRRDFTRLASVQPEFRRRQAKKKAVDVDERDQDEKGLEKEERSSDATSSLDSTRKKVVLKDFRRDSPRPQPSTKSVVTSRKDLVDPLAILGRQQVSETDSSSSSDVSPFAVRPMSRMTSEVSKVRRRLQEITDPVVPGSQAEIINDDD